MSPCGSPAVLSAPSFALADSAGALWMIGMGIAVPDWYTTQLATVIAFYFAGKTTNGKE